LAKPERLEVTVFGKDCEPPRLNVNHLVLATVGGAFALTHGYLIKWLPFQAQRPDEVLFLITLNRLTVHFGHLKPVLAE